MNPKRKPHPQPNLARTENLRLSGSLTLNLTPNPNKYPNPSPSRLNPLSARRGISIVSVCSARGAGVAGSMSALPTRVLVADRLDSSDVRCAMVQIA